VSQYQKGKTNLDFTEAGDSEWQWHQLAICKSAPRPRQIITPAPTTFLFLVFSLFFFVWFRVADLAGYMLAFGRT